MAGRAKRALLHEGNAALESVFLRLGSLLEPLAGGMERPIGPRDELVSYSSGRVDGKQLFEEAVGLMNEPLRHIDALVARHEDLGALLQSCEDRTGEMDSLQREMQTMLGPLAYGETLFKIESAGLDEDIRETFLSVAREIGHLRRLVDETFRANAERLDLTFSTLSEVRRSYEADMREHASHLKEVHDNIDASIKRLDGDLARNARLDAQRRVLSEELRHRVEVVVTSLQLQDIVKQQTEHLSRALALIELRRADSRYGVGRAARLRCIPPLALKRRSHK